MIIRSSGVASNGQSVGSAVSGIANDLLCAFPGQVHSFSIDVEIKNGASLGAMALTLDGSARFADIVTVTLTAINGEPMPVNELKKWGS